MPGDLNYDFRFNFYSLRAHIHTIMYTFKGTQTRATEKGAVLFIVSEKKKKVQKQKGFVDAKIPPPLLASATAQHTSRQPYLQTHYTRFVLKTVQFIGGAGPPSLPAAYPLSAALILLFEGESRPLRIARPRVVVARDKSDL